MIVATALVTFSCSSTEQMMDVEYTSPTVAPISNVESPTPDPRVGLGAGLFDAEEATWNLTMLSQSPPPKDFLGVTNSDLAFKGQYAIQGNYNGVLVWDISDPSNPVLTKEYLCPASQSDVSVYGDLMFVSGEGYSGRLDCGTEGVQEAVSDVRLRGIRIFDISDIEDPKYIANVQTCRGSHTHSVLKDPEDDENVYVYVSGSAPVRPDAELPGCSDASPSDDPNSALFRIEVIKVPLANPEMAAITSSPRIFENLEEAPSHGLAPADKAAIEEAKANGAFTFEFGGSERVMSNGFAMRMLNVIIEERGGTAGEPTAADTTALRERATDLVNQMFGGGDAEEDEDARRGPNQCHDITLYPEIGLAGGACEGYGLLLDISDPANPIRIDAVADSNFAYWHSATFSNDGKKVLFTDEWGGGGQPKCRESDPMEWGANAIFTIENGKMNFQEYYKLPAPQTTNENCVAHNGSLIPIPGREVMVQSWYQGGISVFDWTDPKNPVEIAFHDRGPVAADRMGNGGSWSVYWYNGAIVSSEIARGLDIFKLEANPYITQNEIDAANSVKLDYLNAQGQPKFVWPKTFALSKAYVDQLERNKELDNAMVNMARQSLANAEAASPKMRNKILTELADKMDGMSMNNEKVKMLVESVRGLASNP
jgi:hypothetical protein